MIHRLAVRLVVAVLLTATLPLHAAAPGEQRLSYGGFGTLGVLYHDDEGREYRRSVSQPRGAEAGELDLETDTLAGLQVNAAWNRALEFVGQGVTRLNVDGDWRPQLTRAFVRYHWSEGLQVRAGRLGWGIYPRADSRDVGYSQLTIRPMVETFGIVPTDRFDGAEATLSYPVSAGVLSLQGYGGRTTIRLANQDGITTDIDDARLWGGHLNYAGGPWTLRIGGGVLQDDEQSPFAGLAGALRGTGEAQATALAERFEQWDQTVLFIVAGAAYDEGPLQMRMFVSRSEADRVIGPNVLSVQFVGGYRLGRLTPYVAAAGIDNHDEAHSTGLPDAPPYAGLNAVVRTVQSFGRYNQHSIVAGLRYDLAPGLALKGQIDRVFLRDSALVYDRRQPPEPSDHMTVLGLALDFVF